jgi:NADPH:quinone reductase-like Zn-dependent oxidoreductase
VIGIVVRDDGLLLDESLPTPVAGEGEVLVEMEAACLSPLDVQIATGRFPVRPAVPYVGGTDGAGRVVSGGGALSGKRVRIRGAGVGMTRSGCAAGRVALPAAALHELREDVDAGTAATFFVPCSTAFAALHHVGRVQPGERVGVRGAAGSVGQVAVQLALAAGAAEVTGIVSSQERAAAVPGGARAVVAGSGEELRDRLHGADLDLLVDTVAGPGLSACVGAMRGGGRIVLVGYAGGVRVEFDATELLVRDVSLLPLNGIGHESDTVPHSGEWLDAIARGDLRLTTSVFPVERFADALAAVCGSPSPGRVALAFG